MVERSVIVKARVVEGVRLVSCGLLWKLKGGSCVEGAEAILLIRKLVGSRDAMQRRIH